MRRPRTRLQRGAHGSALGIAERVLERQLVQVTSQDEKTRHILTLSIVALGGGLSLGLWVGELAIIREALWLLVAGAGCNIVSLMLLVDAYAGIWTRWTEIAIGPAPDELLRARDSHEGRMATLLLVSTGSYYRHNEMILSRRARRRTLAVLYLLAGVVSYAAAYVYIVAR